MFQRLMTAFRGLVGSARATPMRRSVRLNVLVLECRATPSATPSFVAPIVPPEVVLVANFSVAPAVNITLPTTPANSLVRTDLIVVGGSGTVDSAQEWENWMRGNLTPQDDGVFPPRARPPETDAVAPPIDLKLNEAMLEEIAALAEVQPLAA